MTMPDERLRAIRWGEELLHHIASDGTLPDAIVSKARRILQSYPGTPSWDAWLLCRTAGLPTSCATALSDARALFVLIKVGGHGSEPVRSHLMYTMRHFPDDRTIRLMSRASELRDWVK